MTKTLHPIAGGVALLTILTFWMATALSELFGDTSTIVRVKTLIPWGFAILIPALVTVGVTGTKRAQRFRGPLVAKKQKQMPFLAANGLLVLIPSAFYLSFKAQAGSFDAAFYAVQTIELVAGAVNITLLALNIRDGLSLTRWRRRLT